MFPLETNHTKQNFNRFFNDGTARFINQTKKNLIWETTYEKSNELAKDLFLNSQNIINQIGV